MSIVIGSDHAGWNLKKAIKEYLEAKGIEVADIGPATNEPCDYSDKALEAAQAIADGKYSRGILICGTGVGMSMAANRVRGVRAALCWTEYLARMSRAHNNANVLCLGERATGVDLALSILDVWLNTEFEGGRHSRRIAKFDPESG